MNYNFEILIKSGKSKYIKQKQELFNTYKNQSMDRISVISLIGRPTAVSTIVMVTSPACGTPAAPMAAAVAVRLKKGKNNVNSRIVCL